MSAEYGRPLYAMMWDCYHQGYVQYQMNGGFVLDRPVAIFKLRSWKK